MVILDEDGACLSANAVVNQTIAEAVPSGAGITNTVAEEYRALRKGE
jgi:hypothetical protein